jgi:Aromatic-ring-opening dioxygenase LigAB, LigA subunit
MGHVSDPVDEAYRRRLADVVPATLPSGVDIFGEEARRRGFRLNRAGYSLKDAGQRARFVEDEAGWMEQFGLTPEEQALIRDRDWIGLWRAGMSIYVIVKLCGVTDTPLTVIGRQMRESGEAG